MTRDTFTVPATDAGVEREFSKSERATPWTRSRLSARIISETMRYQNYLARIERPLTPRPLAKDIRTLIAESQKKSQELINDKTKEKRLERLEKMEEDEDNKYL